MPYTPSFAGNSLGVGPAAEALVPASICSAAIGMVSLGAWAIFDAGEVALDNPTEVVFSLFAAAYVLAVGWVAAIFVVAFYLCIFGLPVALLLGDRIRHPLALGVSLIDACAGAVVATTGSKLGLLSAGEFSLGFFVLVLCFALPAGYLYRRNIIALREQAEFI